MGSEDRALPLKARRSREPIPAAGPPDDLGERRRETEEYARQAMVSSARAHDRAAVLLERMAVAHPDEADAHLQSAARHRRWAENDRRLAEKHAPGDDQ
ncbi:hypothetical protein D0T12_33285 [Actinomadura spongiicola]|uniref:Uncharacterized protein n=1 Tax=Actinomadura spongiicola TaxID=2303421 RepID=A0A372G7G6_9ACTN|nr:hypothetical protein [Actinomadura spongiicola]RFS81247.1 hypothetical protein D0T12_33285 [Actinomadura spongiicola]